MPKPLLGTSVSRVLPSKPLSASVTRRFSRLLPRACSNSSSYRFERSCWAGKKSAPAVYRLAYRTVRHRSTCHYLALGVVHVVPDY